MSSQTEPILEAFNWRPQPDAAALVGRILGAFCRRCSAAAPLAERLYGRTGSRLIDWIDLLTVPADEGFTTRLSALGFVPQETPDRVAWLHPEGLFPRIEVHEQPVWRAAIKVESVADFLSAGRVQPEAPVEGSSPGRLRKAKIAGEGDAELWVVERHGYRGWDVPEVSAEQAKAARSHQEGFRRRKRGFEDEHAGFEHALTLIRRAADDLGAGWACDLFFAAERRYWTAGNLAARTQKARQDALGLGWGNHDHHTYRSSRAFFPVLISVLEALGLECRERFYAGKEAGWGAQVMEHPEAGVVVFADVDLAPDEVSGDFAHQALPPSGCPGTVGLWCRLHGEAFLQAGMHHLECRFDFAAASKQLEEQGVQIMPPFSDLPYLKQAFTKGEIWPVAPGRIDAALADRVVTEDEAERFRRIGAIGSHFEILQRDDGYKGFNKAGINEIIRHTDPRRQP